MKNTVRFNFCRRSLGVGVGPPSRCTNANGRAVIAWRAINARFLTPAMYAAREILARFLRIAAVVRAVLLCRWW